MGYPSPSQRIDAMYGWQLNGFPGVPDGRQQPGSENFPEKFPENCADHRQVLYS